MVFKLAPCFLLGQASLRGRQKAPEKSRCPDAEAGTSPSPVTCTLQSGGQHTSASEVLFTCSGDLEPSLSEGGGRRAQAASPFLHAQTLNTPGTPLSLLSWNTCQWHR